MMPNMPLWCFVLQVCIFKSILSSWTKNITPLKFVYVLGDMWEIKFQERSSKNHVIHKVNFMVITKVKFQKVNAPKHSPI